MDRHLLCGGQDPTTRDTCLHWSSVTGSWEESLTLDVKRFYHASWTPDPDLGTYLMGGANSEAGRTTTLIKKDGSQEPGFPLKMTKYVCIMYNVYRY